MDIFNRNELRDGDRVEVEVNRRDGTDPYKVIGTYSKYGDSVAGFIPMNPLPDTTVRFVQAWRSAPVEPTGLGAVVRVEYRDNTHNNLVRASVVAGCPWLYAGGYGISVGWVELAAGPDVASLTVLSAGFEGDL